MDSLYWKQLNSKIISDPTRKQFFGRYLCKLVMNVPCARLVHQHQDIAVALEDRRKTHRHPNYGGSWRYGAFHMQQLDNADAEQLEIVRSIKDDYKGTIRVRVEEPWVQFYADSEDDLKVIATRFNSVCKERLMSVSVPASDDIATMLKSGDIIVSTDIGFEYKVYVRDGLYSHETKAQLLAYFDSLGNEVQLSKGTRKQLEGPLGYIWGLFFYVKDPKTLTFVSLIHPSVIRKIHRLVPASK